MPTSQEIRDQYLANQIFLIGEKLGPLEVIDRRTNYIVVVDAQGVDKKMSLDEAYACRVPDEHAPPVEIDGVMYTHSGDGDLIPMAPATPVQESKIAPKGLKFSTFSTTLNEGVFTYKGFRGTNISKNVECENIFLALVERCEDPWAMLNAVKAVDAYFEHRSPGTLDRALTAISKVDDPANHTYFEAFEATVPVVPTTENKSIFVIKQTFDVLDEDCDFEIQEALTYSGFRSVLTEDFERDVHKTMAKLEKNPHELDELTHHVRTIADIAHHYEKHAVHMEGFMDGMGWKGHLVAGVLAANAAVAVGAGGMMIHHEVKEHQFHTQLQKVAPADHAEYMKHYDAYNSQRGIQSHGKTSSSYNKDPELAAKSQAAMDAIKAKHKELTESREYDAIQHAEPTKHISVRKLSSGPQLVKIAKRAAVELIAQKLANKPIKKISKKEKGVIIDAIKKRKGVVLKLAKKLIPRIKSIESAHHEHEHESGMPGTDSKGEFGSAGG